MSARIGVAIMATMLALYIVLVGHRAVLLVATGEPIGVGMGVALIVLPVIAAWALWREVSFGLRASKLGARLESEGALPADVVAVSPSGKPDRDTVDALFPAFRADVEEHPDDWRAWYRLGLAYDGAGDRSRARQAVRKAIALDRSARG
ncbi:tetratricopeptide repeat protein [Microbacterium invictum]|uniref:Cytochrome c-type biogenesis protein CcmH/NrfG n=1 Tax=Microbacterium invictum TaxID=515415 RepID=A0AA40SNL8_9MICO|nr:tetratricopeptide repeat protein [Microbacterium invictum]MBB4139541.1 cytochrome c-type biogenesis protein CcmH/NrfG [Microbacterium invictum]